MVYEYRCRDCGMIFEVSKPLSKIDRSEPCPDSEGHETERMISLSSFQFRGAGWASDGYTKK